MGGCQAAQPRTTGVSPCHWARWDPENLPLPGRHKIRMRLPTQGLEQFSGLGDRILDTVEGTGLSVMLEAAESRLGFRGFLQTGLVCLRGWGVSHSGPAEPLRRLDCSVPQHSRETSFALSRTCTPCLWELESPFCRWPGPDLREEQVTGEASMP